MNRWLIVAVAGLFVGGCAAGVDDPQPNPPDQPAKEHPAQTTFSGEVPPNPYEVGVAHSITDAPPALPEQPILPERPSPSHPDGEGNAH